VKWFQDHPGALALLDDGPQIVLPEGLTWPDGTTDPRTNYFDAGSPAATLAKWLKLQRTVRPDAWSAATAYSIGDTCWRLTGGVPVGYRAVQANTNSAPTLANTANWSAYLGPLPAGWEVQP
jgi:hypothetical protein